MQDGETEVTFFEGGGGGAVCGGHLFRVTGDREIEFTE